MVAIVILNYHIRQCSEHGAILLCIPLEWVQIRVFVYT